MGKQGPCYHCGVTSTPLWRNGPPDKPVLCNACGSRWRTKGTLLNYTPLHSRGDYEDKWATKVKSISLNKNKETKLLKRKYADDNIIANGGVPLDYNSGFTKFVAEDMSNRSSFGSAMSNSNLQYESADGSDLTGPTNSFVWESIVPSWKRPCVKRPEQSSVEQLTKDLHAIMHEQQSSCFSESFEEDLLFQSSTTPMSSFEIGHGAVIFRDPSSVAREEESEASSLSFDSRQFRARNGVSFASPSPRIEKIKRPTEKIEISQNEHFHILGNHNSEFPTINLKDVIDVDEFLKHLTCEEEQQLLKYLCSGYKVRLADSLKTFFDCSEFKENLSAFPQLLAEELSSDSFSGVKVEDRETLKKLTFYTLMKRKEVESQHSFEESKNSSSASSNSVGEKRPLDAKSRNFSETRGMMMMMMSPKRPSFKGNYESKGLMDHDGSCFSPRSLFTLPHDSSILKFDTSPFIDENFDDSLLLNVSSSSLFPEAELLHPR